MQHRLSSPPRSLRTALFVLRTGALALVVLAGVWAPAHDAGSGPFTASGQLPPRLQQAMDRHDCSTTGFDGATPASALVRSADGRLRLVDFDRGWQVFTRHGSATLVAVCLDHPPR